MFIADKNIARMHIRMEEAVAEDLGEEDLHATFCQQLHINAMTLQRGYVWNRNAVDALHHHHGFAAVIGIDFRHIEHAAIFKIPAQLNGVGRFT